MSDDLTNRDVVGLGRGVTFDERASGKHYRARFHFARRVLDLGRYSTQHEARLAYDQVATAMATFKRCKTNYPPGSHALDNPDVDQRLRAFLAQLSATALVRPAPAGAPRTRAAGQEPGARRAQSPQPASLAQGACAAGTCHSGTSSGDDAEVEEAMFRELLGMVPALLDSGAAPANRAHPLLTSASNGSSDLLQPVPGQCAAGECAPWAADAADAGLWLLPPPAPAGDAAPAAGALAAAGSGAWPEGGPLFVGLTAQAPPDCRPVDAGLIGVEASARPPACSPTTSASSAGAVDGSAIAGGRGLASADKLPSNLSGVCWPQELSGGKRPAGAVETPQPGKRRLLQEPASPQVAAGSSGERRLPCGTVGATGAVRGGAGAFLGPAAQRGRALAFLQHCIQSALSLHVALLAAGPAESCAATDMVRWLSAFRQGGPAPACLDAPTAPAAHWSAARLLGELLVLLTRPQATTAPRAGSGGPGRFACRTDVLLVLEGLTCALTQLHDELGRSGEPALAAGELAAWSAGLRAGAEAGVPGGAAVAQLGAQLLAL
ncbi:hypothetical protein HT031_002911 [Scenedesmus sp. PABB004]|nr:hypothetical protein HT031_002911 [Scenedesmus sp. PABB004]